MLLAGVVFARNPLHSYLDSASTLDDLSAYLCGLNTGSPTDADTLAIRGNWRGVIIWSDAAGEAAIVKSRFPNIALVLYMSTDMMLANTNQLIDTTDIGGANEWPLNQDEYSHLRKICNDSNQSYNSLFYHFKDTTWTKNNDNDTIEFLPCTNIPATNADTMSIFPDSYSRTVAALFVENVSGHTSKFYRYRGGKTNGTYYKVRANPDYTNPLARYALLNYMMRALGKGGATPNYRNLGGTGNDVYYWGTLSDSGMAWDGIYLDNFNSGQAYLDSDHGQIIIKGGTIMYGRTGATLGIWGADSTNRKMYRDFQEGSRYFADYFEDSTHFWDNKPKVLAGNMGNDGGSWGAFGDTVHFSSASGMHILVNEWGTGDMNHFEFYQPREGGTNYYHRTSAVLKAMDSLMRANDMFIFNSVWVDYQDTTAGYREVRAGVGKSIWVRDKIFWGSRGIVASTPPVWSAALNREGNAGLFYPCIKGYGGLSYSPNCNDRSEVDTFITTQPKLARTFDFGLRDKDTLAKYTTVTDSSGASCKLWRSFYRVKHGNDSIYTYFFYLYRQTEGWSYLHSANHYVYVTPPDASWHRMEYDGTTTAINGAAQQCWMGDGLILVKGDVPEALNTPPGIPVLESPVNGATDQYHHPTLVVNNTTDEDGNTLTYNFQVANDSAFTSLVVSSLLQISGVTTTSWTVTSELADSTTYWWKARAYDGEDYGGFPIAWSFTTRIDTNRTPTAPVLVTPLGGDTIGVDPVLTIINSTDPDDGDILTYQFEVSTDSLFSYLSRSAVGVTQGTTTSSWTVTPSLVYDSTYYWRVYAFDGTVFSDPSDTLSFSTGIGITVNPASLSFVGEVDSTVVDQTVYIDVVGGYGGSVINSTDSAWVLTLSCSTGKPCIVPTVLTVGLDYDSRPAGIYRDTISVEYTGAINSPVKIPVTLTIGTPSTGTRLMLRK
jgi:hypothetical protein